MDLTFSIPETEQRGACIEGLEAARARWSDDDRRTLRELYEGGLCEEYVWFTVLAAVEVEPVKLERFRAWARAYGAIVSNVAKSTECLVAVNTVMARKLIACIQSNPGRSREELKEELRADAFQLLLDCFDPDYAPES